MNIKKILSCLIAMIMVFGVVAGILPVHVEAAHSSSVSSGTKYNKDEIKEIVKESYKYEFDSTAEMLAYELERGYLDSATYKGGKYTIYVNRYTGVMYYLNNATGQILTSNPSDPAKTNMSDDVRMDLMSQLNIAFMKQDGSVTGETTYLSCKWAAEYAQIKVYPLSDGLRVNYTFGDTSSRYIVPGQLTQAAYHEYILEPLLEKYVELLEEYIREFYPDTEFEFLNSDTWGKYNTYKSGAIEQRALQKYFEEMNGYAKTLRDKKKITTAEYNEIRAMYNVAYSLCTAFSAKNPAAYDYSTDFGKEQLDEMYELYPLTKEGTVVYSRNAAYTDVGTLRNLQNLLLNNTDYNSDLLEVHENECGYVEPKVENFVFRCSLEYTFKDDGSLQVRMPTNSITFDDVQYMLSSITVLPYFGAGNLKDDGYIFIPDGSGSIIEFDDFYNSNFKHNIAITLGIYGDDYTYTTPSGFYKEQVTMPVYGMVSTERATELTKTHSQQEKFTTGFLCILEEGESMSKLNFKFGGTRHYYASAYSSFSPYPTDVYDLTDTITVSGVSSYRIVSQARYTGSYIACYKMLGDETLSMAAGESFYPASYVGMASCYRDYLKDKGVLTPLQDLSDSLPLYVEALGSMNVVTKFLTFPVTVSKPLTTFEDIITMYNEFARAKDKLNEKADEYKAMSDAETRNTVLREKYLERSLEYRQLAEELDNITNVNFKLTGFANGGMYFTYPSNVRWESACGGDAGLNALINATKEKAQQGQNFSIFPEFDFMYMSNSALFDGIDENKDIARMLDNRFASKKQYNSVLAIYQSLFSLVVSSGSFEDLYSTFSKNYDRYGIPNLSLSTMGSDINSNLNVDDFIAREDSKKNIMGMLDSVKDDNYNLLIHTGNAYTWPYADHILDIATDSSHLAYTSYTIPFVGMVLHSYVSYTGQPLNYTGSPDYDILRSIENGASLYYILCYQNTNYMKEDDVLNKYYGVDYENWYDDVVERYNELNAEIGDLQAYEIVDHMTLIAERIIDESEIAANNAKLKAEFVELVEAQTLDRINDAFDSIYDDPSSYGKGVAVSIDVDALLEQASVVLDIELDELRGSDLEAELDRVSEYYALEYPAKAGAIEVFVDSIEYTTQYKYVTGSYATDEDYVFTDYTVANDRVVTVTYRHPTTGATSVFILNYNVYAVTVNIEGREPIPLERYGYYRYDL